MNSSPHLKRITLHLVHGEGFPEGSSSHGHLIIAPLDHAAHLDFESWKKLRHLCRVRRFWLGETDRTGFLVHHHGGVAGPGWGFSYPQPGHEPNGTDVRLQAHSLSHGELVHLHHPGAGPEIYKVTRIDD